PWTAGRPPSPSAAGRAASAGTRAARRPPPGRRTRGRSRPLDHDPDAAARRPLDHGQLDGEDAVLEPRPRAPRIDVLGEPDLALERAVLDLHLLVDAARELGAD